MFCFEREFLYVSLGIVELTLWTSLDSKKISMPLCLWSVGLKVYSCSLPAVSTIRIERFVAVYYRKRFQDKSV